MYYELSSYTGSVSGFAFSASAQDTTATTYTITGSMVDESGNPLSKTEV